jgi:hypothetical protein
LPLSIIVKFNGITKTCVLSINHSGLVIATDTAII